MATMAVSLLTNAPAIIHGVAALVHGFEGLFGKGNGAAKKAAVLQAFKGGTEAYSAVAKVVPQVPLPQLSGAGATALSNLIDAIVTFNNALGVFQHNSLDPAGVAAK